MTIFIGVKQKYFVKDVEFFIIRHVQLFEMSLPRGDLPTPCPSQEGNARTADARIPLLGGARGGFAIHEVAHRVLLMFIIAGGGLTERHCPDYQESNCR